MTCLHASIVDEGENGFWTLRTKAGTCPVVNPLKDLPLFKREKTTYAEGVVLDEGVRVNHRILVSPIVLTLQMFKFEVVQKVLEIRHWR